MTSDSETHTVLLVDDHPLLRQGIARALGSEPDLEVVGEGSTLEEGLEAARELEPDLVILDLGLDESDGLDAIPRIRRAAGGRVLILSMFDEAVYAERCLKAGASGYVMKEEASEVLVDAVRRVLAGEVVVSDAMRRRLVRRVAGRSDGGSVEELTDRELQVFRLVGEGRSTREIAEGLHLSVKTIETHRAKLMRKLGLENANQLVHRAVSWVQREKQMP